MKNTAKLFLLFLLIPMVIFAAEKKEKYTKYKTISKTFNVSKDATLNVSNKYGNIDIVTWNENKIEVIVKITTKGDDEEKVKRRLEEITVEFDANTTNVSAKTMIEKSSSSWKWWGNSNNVNLEINYQIKMPISNHVNLSNDYGGINLNKLEGKATINCDYGKLNIGELLNASNSINIDYTNNSTISYMKSGSINADYSTLRVEKAENIDLNADYAHISFGTINQLNYSCDYGSLKVGEAKNLRGTSDYMNLTIGKLFVSGIFNLDYGSLKIEELGQLLKELKIQSSYTHIKLGVHQNAAFDITASLSYGGFKHGDRFKFNKEIEKPTSKYYEGYYNSPNSGAQVSIKSSYGSVSFNNN